MAWWVKVPWLYPPLDIVHCLYVATLYVKSKEVKRRGIMGFGRKTPFVESGGLFDKMKFVTFNKARVLVGNVCNRQERNVFNVKCPKHSRNKGRRRENFVPIKREKGLA